MDICHAFFRVRLFLQGSLFIKYPLSSIHYPVSNRGFTLIEILVAISILAISLVVILQLFSGGLKSVLLSDQYTRAVFYAREKMDEILLLENLEEGNSEGESDDSLGWKAEIVRMEQKEDEESKLPFDTFLIKLDVVWKEGEKDKHFEISTMKVVEKKKGDEVRK